MKKVVVVMSGGLDSSTALAECIADPKLNPVIGIFFSYKQKHGIPELHAARKVIEHFQLEGKLALDFDLHMCFFDPLTESSLLAGSELQPPIGRSLEEIASSEAPNTFVPGRNIIMLSVAASLAYKHDCDVIVGGWHWDDSSGYPDCRITFINAMANAISWGLGRDVDVYAPLINMTKKDIIMFAHDLGLPIELTWSCYQPIVEGDKFSPCGVCDSCIIRDTALKEVYDVLRTDS